MKKKFLLSTLSAVIVFSITAAKFYDHKMYFMITQINSSMQTTDTIKYLQNNIINHKVKYQHQELNLILKELVLPVKSYSIQSGRMPDKNIKYLVLFFDDPKTHSQKQMHNRDISFLYIYFENEVTNKTALSMSVKHMGEWTETEKEFYGKLIVKNIEGLQEKRNR